MTGQEPLLRAFDNLTDIVFVVMRETQLIRYVNRAARLIMGYSVGDRISEREWTPPQPGEHAPYTRQLTTLTGANITVEVSLTEIALDTGPGLVCTMRQLHDADLSHERLSTLAELCSSALREAPVGIVTFDADGHVTRYNPALLHLFHISDASPRTFVGMSLFDSRTIRANRLEPEIRAVLAGQSIERVIDGFTDPRESTPSSVQVYGVPFYDLHGDPSGGLLIFDDITGLRQAMDALRESERRYRGLVESQQDLIVRTDSHGRFTFVNDAYCRKFGKTSEELLGRSFYPLVHPEDLSNTLAAVQRLNKPPYRINVEQRAATADGWRWLHWEDYAILDEDGQIIEIQAVGRDITPYKETEAALRREHAFAEQLREAGIALTSSLNPDVVLTTILEQARHVIPFDAANISLIRGSTVHIVQTLGYDAIGISDEYVRSIVHVLDDTPYLSEMRDHLRPVVSADVTQDPLWRSPEWAPWIGSWLGAPIIVQGSVVGFFSLESTHHRTYNDHHCDLIVPFVQQAGIAYQNAQLYQQVQDQAIEMDQMLTRVRTVAQATQSILSTLDLTESLGRLLDELRQVVPYDAANIMRLENDAVSLMLQRDYARHGSDPDAVMALRIPLAKMPIVQRIIDTQRPYVCPDTRQDPDWFEHPHAAWIRSWLGAPIIFQGEVVGLFSLDSGVEDRYHREDIDTIELFADLAAIAYQNAHLYQQVQDRYGQLLALYGAGQSILSTLDLDTVLQRLAEQMTSLTDATSTLICTYDPKGQDWVVRAAYARIDVPVRETMRAPGEYIQLQPSTAHRIRSTRNGSQMDRDHLRRVLAGDDLAEHVHSAILVPLSGRHPLTGFALVRDSLSERPPSLDRTLMVDSLAGQAALALQQAELYAEIRQLEHVKSEMLRIASHDLRTPLQRIRSAVEMLEQACRPLIDDDRSDYFGFALAGVDEMKALIEDILSLERIEARHLAPEAIVWQAVVSQAVETVRLDCEIKRLSLTLDCPDDLPPASGDAVQISRVLANLLNNAVKYTPSGGEIHVRAYQQWISGTPFVAVEVSDTGLGIPPDAQAHLFEPFYRAPQSAADPVPGIGLGLSVVKTAVNDHGGQVYFSSEPGQGSTFGFRLPV